MDASGACTGAVDAMKWVNSAWMSQSRSFMCGYCDRFLAQVWVIKRNVLCAKIWKTRKENSSSDSLCCCVWSFTYTSSAELHPNDMCWLFFFGWLCNFFFDLSLERWCETKYHRYHSRSTFVLDFLLETMTTSRNSQLNKARALTAGRCKKCDDGSVNGSGHGDKAILSWLNPPHRALQPCCSHKINNDRASVTWMWKA